MKKIIASFTTIPSRIEFVEPVIESLIQQTIKPDEIHIQIPKYSLKENQVYQIPKFLYHYDEVKIMIRELDYGSATKWIYPLMDLSNIEECILIIMDDDCCYVKNSIEILINKLKEQPDSCVCFTGGKFPMKGTIDSFRKGNSASKNTLTIIAENLTDLEVDTVQGFSMFLVEPKMFKTFDFSILDHLEVRKLSDDIVISGIMEFLKIDRIQVGPFLVPKILKQAEINAIHGDGRLLRMTIAAILYVQKKLNVWRHISVKADKPFTRKLKGIVKKLAHSLSPNL